jgi:hypothetical protein
MALFTISADTYQAKVWYRLTHGLPQPESKIWRSSVEATLPDALQRLGDRVAADPGMYVTLQASSVVTLGTSGTAGEEFVNNFSPTLILSTAARSHWSVDMTINGTGVRFGLVPRVRFHDLINLPNQPDYYFYAVQREKIRIRYFDGSIPSGTLVCTIWGNIVPTVGMQISDELADNLSDIGIEIMSETGDINAIIDAAHRPTAAPKEPPQPGIPMGGMPMPQQ